MGIAKNGCLGRGCALSVHRDWDLTKCVPSLPLQGIGKDQRLLWSFLLPAGRKYGRPLRLARQPPNLTRNTQCLIQTLPVSVEGLSSRVSGVSVRSRQRNQAKKPMTIENVVNRRFSEFDAQFEQLAGNLAIAPAYVL